jgi:hypothetical protein
VTEKQRELARHALGLPNKEKTTYRNHFCIGKGGDGYEDWEDLVKQGFATMAPGGKGWGGDFFYLTFEGAKAVLLPNERIGREDAEKMHRSTA